MSDIDKNGKHKKVYHAILHEDPKQLKWQAAQFEAEESERSRAGVSDKVLFSIAAEEWLVEKRHDIGPMTFAGYTRTVRNELIPT